MLNRRMVLVGALGVMLGALPARSLSGQMMPSWNGRPSIEGSYQQLRFDADGATLRTEGVGARLMWSAAPSDGGVPSLLQRTELGLYGTFAPERRFAQHLRFSSLGLGAVADVRPFASPLAGRVDPFLTLGAGVLRTDLDSRISPAPSPLLDRTRTTATLSPGLGARVRLTPGLALQGDVRDVMTFRGDTRHNVAFGTGVRLTF